MSTTTPSVPAVLRSLPFLLLAVALAVSGLVTPRSESSSPVTRPQLSPVANQLPSPNFTMFTLNVAHDLSVKRARADIEKALTMGADAGGFQEFSPQSHKESLRSLAAQHDWGYWMPSDGHGSASIPIVWNRKRFLMVPGSGTTTLVHGPLGNGYPPRHINTVKVREIATGKVFGLINAHTVAHASFDAQPHDQNGDASRTPNLRRHIKMLKDAIVAMHATTEHVVAVGDLNVNYNADRRRKVAGFPTDVLGGLVLFNMPVGEGSRTGTKSLLDYNMTVKPDRGSGFVPVKSWIERGFRSDHDAVVARYRLVDLFATGPVMNEPRAKGPLRKRVLDRMARVVQDTESGAEVRLVTPDLGYAPLYTALRDAHLRGVAVKVVADGRVPSAYTAALTSVLGVDTGQPSSITLCRGACGSSKGPLQANFVLASRTGGASTVTFNSSGAAAKSAKNHLGDAFLATDPQLYAGFVNSFNRMLTGQDQRNAAKGVALGSYRVMFRPVTDGGKDTTLKALKRVRCANARSPRNSNGRTDVMVSMGTWSGKRGKEIARQLGTLKQRGRCNVRVVVGKDAKKPVRKILRKAGVPLRKAKSHQALLLVDGHYQGKKNNQVVFAGSQSWVNKGLKGEGITVRIDGKKTLKAYRTAFNAAWQKGK